MGADTLDYSGSPGGVIVDLLLGTGINSDAEGDTFASFDHLIGRNGSGGDQLKGNDGVNSISGNAGNDFIEGRAGNDVISDGEGADQIKGQGGADIINLTDDFDRDTIIYNFLFEGGDVINGFNDDDPFASDGDQIDISDLLVGLVGLDLDAAFTDGFINFLDSDPTAGFNFNILQVDPNGGNNSFTTIATINSSSAPFAGEADAINEFNNNIIVT